MKYRKIFSILFSVIIIIIVLILGGCGWNGGSEGSGDGGGGAEGTISLAWDSNTEPELEGYQVYYGNPKR
jgi:hypothetical protein